MEPSEHSRSYLAASAELAGAVDPGQIDDEAPATEGDGPARSSVERSTH